MIRYYFMRYVGLPCGLFFSGTFLFHQLLRPVFVLDAWAAGKISSGVDWSVGTVAGLWGYGRLAPLEPKVPIEDYLCQVGMLYDIDCDLLLAQRKVESGNDSWATSHVGAMGYLQLMPATAKACGMKEAGEAYIPERNVDCGVWWLRGRIDDARGDVAEGLRRYVGGPRCASPGACPDADKYVKDVFNRMAKKGREKNA